MRRIIFVIVLASLLMVGGCAVIVATTRFKTAARLNKVSLGMTKKEVIRAIGKPGTINAQGDYEYCMYFWWPDATAAYRETYYVRLFDGRVESFGRMGAFDSAQPPTRRYEIDAEVRQR